MIAVWKAGVGVVIISGSILIFLPLLTFGIWYWRQARARIVKATCLPYTAVEANIIEQYSTDPPIAVAYIHEEEVHLGNPH